MVTARCESRLFVIYIYMDRLPGRSKNQSSTGPRNRSMTLSSRSSRPANRGHVRHRRRGRDLREAREHRRHVGNLQMRVGPELL